MNLKELPRLLYVGDVPIESSYHGSLLLYRLLERYPRDRLLVLEGNLWPSRVERRLSGVEYRQFQVGTERLLRTRLNELYSTWLTVSARWRVGALSKQLGRFTPQAILTVSHGYSWITAARLASKRNLPLHLICHDDWPRVARLSASGKVAVDSLFADVYRRAASRLCVSPEMATAYTERYGAEAEAEVLYPTRALDAVCYEAPATRTARRPFVVAYAGTVNTRSYYRALSAVADALQSLDGQLFLYGPMTAKDAENHNLARPHIHVRGLVSSKRLIQEIHSEVDVLFVPLSFDPDDRFSSEFSFPSKLADYTAAGVALLIYGPASSAAVRWARKEEDVAEVVDREDSDALSRAVAKLAAGRELREHLGRRALAVGDSYFAYEVGQRILYKAFLNNTRQVP